MSFDYRAMRRWYWRQIIVRTLTGDRVGARTYRERLGKLVFIQKLAEARQRVIDNDR